MSEAKPEKRLVNRVAFVILHYGDPSVTDDCVASILRMDGVCQKPDGQRRSCPEVRVIIVDNDARLPAEQRIAFAKRYQDQEVVSVIQAPVGAGFSFANNLGYAYARGRLHADCIIVCNNDIEFSQPDFLRRLSRSVSRMRCHVLGPRIVRRSTHEPQNPMDTRLRTVDEARYTIAMNRRALALFPVMYPVLALLEKRQERRQRFAKQKETGYYREPHLHIIPFGACLIFTPLFVKEEPKAFEPETQFYYEEYILANRCFQKGYETGYDPSIRVLHETGSATRQSRKSKRAGMRLMMERTASACEIYLEELGKRDGKA